MKVGELYAHRKSGRVYKITDINENFVYIRSKQTRLDWKIPIEIFEEKYEKVCP